MSLSNETPVGAMAARARDLADDVPDRFESQLSARTKVPAARLGDFLKWNEVQVRQEAKVVSRILKRFAAAVVQSMEEPDSMNAFLVELDLKTISRDHDWRAIFSTVRGRDGESSERQKRTVLIKYLQYLSFRKRLLDYIHSRKAGLEETDEISADLTEMPTEVNSSTGNEQSAHRSAIAPPEIAGFGRMPLGETVEFAVADDGVFEFLLGRHRFELLGGERPYIVDKNGVTCFVRHGRNMMGRHPESDLAVDANYNDVSRAHLVLEWDGGELFRIMDLSTRGTWLPDHVIGAAHDAERPEHLLHSPP